MADLIFETRILDINDNLQRGSDLIDEAFPGRVKLGKTKVEWVEAHLKAFLNHKLREAENKLSALEAIELNKAKGDIQ